MDGVIVAARLELAVVFAVAGFAKLADLAGSRQALRGFGMPKVLATPLGTLLPLVELIVAGALLTASAAWWGALGALALLIVFVGAITYNLAQGRAPDCHCFGQLHSAPVGWPTLLRNALLGALAAYVVWRGPGQAGPSLLGWLGALNFAQVLMLVGGLALVGIVAGLAWLTFNLIQQNGRLLLRIEALEARLGIQPTEDSQSKPAAGLALGTTAPRFQLSNLAGETVTLEALRNRGKPVVLVFSDAGCGPCTALLPDIARWQREERDTLTIALIIRGAFAAVQAKVDGLGITDVLLQHNREVADAYGVKATPSAQLVLPNGRIGSTMALGGGAIAELVAQALGAPEQADESEEDDSDYEESPPIGASAPLFALPDLNGKQIGLADFIGRPTLLLFWSPSCGFCQDMLADLQRWIARPPNDAPQLLIISTGSIDENRAMNLHAPLVIDEGFQIGHMLGATGTPMAILVDAEGRIASPVRAGAPAVFALAHLSQRLHLQPV